MEKLNLYLHFFKLNPIHVKNHSILLSQVIRLTIVELLRK